MLNVNNEISKLENFIKDTKYKQQLIESANYYPWVNIKLERLSKLEIKIKEKMKIPLNSSIRFEKIKCSKTCSHNHQYFSAYFWDRYLRKVRKKHIGKSLLNA